MARKFKWLVFILVFSIALRASIVNVLAQEELIPPLGLISSAEDINPLMRFGYGWAKDIAWSPDGASLVVASSIGVWLYNTLDFQAEPLQINENVFNADVVEYSSDGHLLAAAGSELYLWDATSHELIQSFNTENILDVAFSRDNSEILVSHGFGARSYGLELWNIETGRKVIIQNEGVFSNLVFSPDGQYFAAIRLSDCCFRSYLWDTHTWNILFSGDMEVRADDERLVFSPDSSTLVAVDRTGSFKVFDLQSQTVTKTIVLDTETNEYYPAEAAFTPDGSLLIELSRSGMLRVWDTASYDSSTSLNLNWEAYAARLSPDGTQIAAIDRSGNLRVWELKTGNLVAQRDNFAIDDPIIAFSPDGSLLASGATGGEIWLWDIAAGEPLFVLSGHEDAILALDFSSDGQFLASASADGTVRLWDIATRQLTRIIASGDYTTVIIDSHNQILIADDYLVQIYDLASNEAIQWFYDSETDSYSDQLEMAMPITAIAFEDNRLAVVTNGRQVQLWERNSNETWDVSRGFSDLRINAITVNEYSLSYAGDNNVVLQWGISQGTRILSTHNSWIYAITSNSEVLVSGGCAITRLSSWDGSPYCAGAELRLWSFVTAYPEYNLISQLHGHTAPIQDAALNPADTLLATVSDDGTILLWGNLLSDE